MSSWVTSTQSLERITEAHGTFPAGSYTGNRAVKPAQSAFKSVQLQFVQRPNHLDRFSTKPVFLIEIITKALDKLELCKPISCAATSDTQEILGHWCSILQK